MKRQGVSFIQGEPTSDVAFRCSALFRCSVHFRLGVGTFGGALLRPTHLTPDWGRGRVGAHVAERRIHLLVEKLYDFHPVSITKLRLDNRGVFIHSVFIGFTGFFPGIFVIEVGRLPKVEEHFAAAALDSDSCLGKLGYFSNNR